MIRFAKRPMSTSVLTGSDAMQVRTVHQTMDLGVRGSNPFGRAIYPFVIA